MWLVRGFYFTRRERFQLMNGSIPPLPPVRSSVRSTSGNFYLDFAASRPLAIRMGIKESITPAKGSLAFPRPPTPSGGTQDFFARP